MALEKYAPPAYRVTGKSTGPDIPVIADGWYRVMVKDVSLTIGEFGEQYMLEFELLDYAKENGGELTLASWIKIPDSLKTAGTLNDGSNLYKFVIACGWTDDNLEEAIDPGAWQGCELWIQVVNETSKSKDGEQVTRPKIRGYKDADPTINTALVPRQAKPAAPVSPAPARPLAAPAARGPVQPTPQAVSAPAPRKGLPPPSAFGGTRQAPQGSTAPPPRPAAGPPRKGLGAAPTAPVQQRQGPPRTVAPAAPVAEELPFEDESEDANDY